MKRTTKTGGLVILALSVDGPRLLWHVTRIQGGRHTTTYEDHATAIKHIRHAFEMLKPGGKLVALCANGPRQQAAFKAAADHWEVLPAGSFKAQGTNVSVALVVLSKGINP